MMYLFLELFSCKQIQSLSPPQTQSRICSSTLKRATRRAPDMRNQRVVSTVSDTAHAEYILSQHCRCPLYRMMSYKVKTRLVQHPLSGYCRIGKGTNLDEFLRERKTLLVLVMG